MKTTTTKKTAKRAPTGKSTATAKRKSGAPRQRLSPKRSSLPARASDALKPNDQRRTSKKAAIEALVRRTEGAAIAELTAATGWQEHSVRAALTGLRKDRMEVSRSKDADGTSRYRIAAGS